MMHPIPSKLPVTILSYVASKIRSTIDVYGSHPGMACVESTHTTYIGDLSSKHACMVTMLLDLYITYVATPACVSCHPFSGVADRRAAPT